MPATKRLQDRDAKRAELVHAARRLFVDTGYERTSMSALAQAAGVAGNTIYWYFEDKDAVLVAVLDAVMTDAWTDYQAIAAGDLEDQLLWVVQQLRQMRRLVATVHARVEQAPAVSVWHDAFHEVTERVLAAALKQTGTEAADVEAEVKIAVFAIEGMLTHDLDEPHRRAICHRLATQRRPSPTGG